MARKDREHRRGAGAQHCLTIEAPDLCPLCDRPLIPGPSVNLHHLVPRRYRGRDAIAIHRVCHSKIHAVLSDRELRDVYHTFERLRTHPELAKFIRWLARKDPTFVGRNAPTRRNMRYDRPAL